VPEYSFLSEESEPVVASVETDVIGLSLTDSKGDSLNGKSAMLEQAVPMVEDKMSTTKLVSLIVGINMLILIVGGGLIYWLTLDKKLDFNLMKKFKAVKYEKGVEETSARK
jgi:hypothetical protein